MMLTRMRKYVSEFIFLIADIRTILVRSPDSIPSGNEPKPGPLALAADARVICPAARSEVFDFAVQDIRSIV